MPKPPSDWITLAEAVDILAEGNIRVSRSTLARWAREGRVQSARPGRTIYVRRSQIRLMLHPRGHGGIPDVPLPRTDTPPGQVHLFDDPDE
jgi:hypothetical protein